ncbi:type II toxin-antitoxin system RelE/ParE family toxin [Rhizobium sp. SL42]|nr:type II toxin-antitoxin system RelE/ParE family toxin [Rhizobium sp. SL42]UJW76266.1 type II toxin-antitoxin system RelE/ParE family toxin [Rhizobium sp. SL42]
MSSYSLRPSAEADLEEIWDYTAEIWSVTQAEHYVSDIFASISHLVANPHLGRPVSGYIQTIVDTKSGTT